MTTTQITKGQIVHFDFTGESATVIGFVIDADEHMVAVRWNGTGCITHEYASDLRA